MNISELYLKELIMVQKIHRELVGGQNPVDLAQLYNNFCPTTNRLLTAPNANQTHRQRPVQMGTNCANFENCLENCQQINVGTNERPSNFMVHPRSVSMPRAHFVTPNFVNNNSSTLNVSIRSENVPKNIVQNATPQYSTKAQILSQSEQKMTKNYAKKINQNQCAGTSSTIIALSEEGGERQNLKNNSGVKNVKNGETDDAFVIDVESMQIFDQKKLNGFDQLELDEINFESVGTSKSFDQPGTSTSFDQPGTSKSFDQKNKFNELDQTVTTFGQHMFHEFDQDGSVETSATFGQHMFHEFDQDGSAETSATFDQHKMNGFDQPGLDEFNSEISETSPSCCPTFDDNWTIETEETNDSWTNGKIKDEFVNDEIKSANFGQFCAVAIKEEILEISEFDEMIANEAMLKAEAAENTKLEKMAQFNAKNQIGKGKSAMKKCVRHEEKIDVKVGKCEWAECDQEFANDNQLYDHIRITHIGELNTNKNEIDVKNCGQHCIDDDDAAAADTSSRFACKWKNCDHSPRRGDAQRKFVWLLNHIFVWHLPKAETHICVFVGCKMRFKKLTALTAHLHTVHAERLTPKKRGQKRPNKKCNDSDDDNNNKSAEKRTA